MIKIGLAEDDLKLAQLIQTGLTELNYEVRMVHDGINALSFFRSQTFDLLILDILMPGIDGVNLCRALRQSHPEIPILMLTALSSVDDKVAGLQAGADDYLPKPFHFRELNARIQALLRRSHPPLERPLLQYEELAMDLAAKEVSRSGQKIDLTAKEFQLLELFLKHPNKVLSRQFIAENAWDSHFDTDTNVIDVYVNFLRKKIDRNFERKFIHTKIGMGYLFK